MMIGWDDTVTIIMANKAMICQDRKSQRNMWHQEDGAQEPTVNKQGT